MAHNLILNYGLYRKMEVYVSSSVALEICSGISFALQRPHAANFDDITKYHSDEYVVFLRNIRPDNMTDHNRQMQRCRLTVSKPPH